MARNLTLLLVASISLAAQAQSWCPPGAEWVFRPDPAEVMTAGYEHFKYEGDTVVGGRAAQYLSRERAYIYWTISGPISGSEYHPVSVITHEENGVVSMWNDFLSTWDTLYWFSGTIGDKWEEIFYPDGGWYEIVDTMTVIEGNVALRRVEIAHQCDGNTGSHWQTEREGGTWAFWLPPPCGGVFHGLWSLSCYRDDEIGPPDLSMCIPNLPIGVTEQTLRIGVSPYPNPGTTHFTLHLPPGPHTIELFDPTGRRMLHQRTTEERPVIGTQDLPPGLFLVRVTDAMGIATTHRWIGQ